MSYKFILIFFLSALTTNSWQELLKCKFNSYKLPFIDEISKYCDIEDANFRKLNLTSEIIQVNGNFELKNSTTLVAFFKSNIEQLPGIQIMKEFPNLLYLEILKSQVPPRISSDFLQDFSELKGVTIAFTNLKHIHENLFSHLKELEFVDLGGNKISKIERNIFKHNSKLKVINLSSNKMKFLSPSVFDNLKELSYFYFTDNKCASESFTDFNVDDLELIKDALEPCFLIEKSAPATFCNEQSKCFATNQSKELFLAEFLDMKQKMESQAEEIENLKQSHRAHLSTELKMSKFQEELFELKSSMLVKNTDELKFRKQIVENARDLFSKVEIKVKLLTLKVLKIKAILAALAIKHHKLKKTVYNLIAVVFLILFLVA